MLPTSGQVLQATLDKLLSSRSVSTSRTPGGVRRLWISSIACWPLAHGGSRKSWATPRDEHPVALDRLSLLEWLVAREKEEPATTISGRELLPRASRLCST